MNKIEQFRQEIQSYSFSEIDEKDFSKTPDWWQKEGLLSSVLGSFSLPGATRRETISRDFFEQVGSLYDYIINYCNEMHMDEVDLYKKAAIPRSTFSKIRSMRNNDYNPSKYPTIVCLALAMKLGKDDAQVFVNLAGYHLSNSNKPDIVVMYCIENGIFSVERVNDYLEDYVGKRMLISA